MPEADDSPTDFVFVSYATPDRHRVVPLCDRLTEHGIEVWIDFRRILPGQDWNLEIRRALARANIILVFVSNTSVDRRGYVQRELKAALDQQSERLADDIYVIPIILDDDTTIPEQVRRLQCIRSTEADWEHRVEETIRFQLARLGRQVAETQARSGVKWSRTIYREEVAGLPGYRCEYDILRFESDKYRSLSNIYDLVLGTLTEQLMEMRQPLIEQSTEVHNYGQDAFFRTNSLEIHCGEPRIAGRMLTIVYSVFSMYAGAAHPNHGFLTFSFLLTPLLYIQSLECLFDDPDAALEIIRKGAREALLEIDFSDEAAIEPEHLDPNYVNSGTEAWVDFSCFAFTEEGLELLFGNYAVAPYAMGPQVATLAYPLFGHLLKPVFASALDIEHMIRRLQHEKEASSPAP